MEWFLIMQQPDFYSQCYLHLKNIFFSPSILCLFVLKKSSSSEIWNLCRVNCCIFEQYMHDICWLYRQTYVAIDGASKVGKTALLMRDTHFIFLPWHWEVSIFLHVFESPACFNYVRPILSDAWYQA
jgi:hypothetical protein